METTMRKGQMVKMQEWRATREMADELERIMNLGIEPIKYAPLMRQIVADFIIRQREVENG